MQNKTTVSIFLLLSAVMATPVSKGVDENTRAEFGYPPRIQDWGFQVAPTGTPGLYALTIHESAESYLGTRVFLSLAERFSNVEGVDSVEQEDRELYLVRSARLTPSRMQEAFWIIFLRAAGESIQE